jgi:hypothetical protein
LITVFDFVGAGIGRSSRQRKQRLAVQALMGKLAVAMVQELLDQISRVPVAKEQEMT